MIKRIDDSCMVPRVNKLLVLLLFVFVAEAVYIGYIKEKTDNEYGLLIQLKSLNIAYQKIAVIFDKKSNHQSFDEIVRNTQQFNSILEKIRYHASDHGVIQNNDFLTQYEKLLDNYKYSQEYVERYKSWSGLTVNSARLIYDEHERIHQLISESKHVRQRNNSIALLDEIIRMVALLNYDGLSDIYVMRSKLNAISSAVSQDEVISKEISQLEKPVEMLIEGYEVMQALKKENEELRVNQNIDGLHKVLLDSFKKRDRENEKNILVSNALILILFIILFITNKKETRLHYEICKINIELESSVNELESVNTSMSKLMDKLDKNIISSKTDAKGVITYASEAFCEISGYSIEELIGLPHNVVRHPDMPKEIYKEVWSTIQKGKEWSGEIKNATKNKGHYWVDVTISPEFNEDGEISGYSAIRHDITAKKELEVLSHSLEDQVKLRTQELEDMVKKVETLSITDELTQLYNRRYYSQILDTEIKRAKRNKRLFNYVLIDIDNFKRYNDTYGHQLGDVTLKEVAKALKQTCQRPNDFVFRMGGEEFAVIFTSENKEQAINFSQKINQAVASLKIEHLKSPPLNILTVSGGLVIYEAAGDDMDESLIYKKADELFVSGQRRWAK